MRTENHIELFQPAPLRIDRRSRESLAALEIEQSGAPDLLSYWTVLRKRRWTVVAMLAVVFTVVLIATLKETPLYEAKALIEIEKENPNIVTAGDLFEIDSVNSTFLETQYKVLETESLSRRVIRDLKLDRLAEFNPPRHWWSLPQLGTTHSSAPPATANNPAPDSDAVYNSLKVFKDRLDIEPLKQSRLVEVSFESRDSVLAARVVNSLTSNYIDQNLELRWDAAEKASEWLSQQLVGVKVKLEKSEDEMQAIRPRQRVALSRKRKRNHREHRGLAAAGIAGGADGGASRSHSERVGLPSGGSRGRRRTAHSIR